MSSIDNDIKEIRAILEIIAHQTGLKNRITPKLIAAKIEEMEKRIEKVEAVKEVKKPKTEKTEKAA